MRPRRHETTKWILSAITVTLTLLAILVLEVLR